ncbi:hypothetical protein BD410DRAFT_559686 [Rickenella mellea]|uniref:OB domain-containing protein n=1 Tax=Rickenella mellea TaxID=50990 RepID=A0A4Y7QE62_9AGAM|nr:hypothetical protein BD410DRAFT_559686 [Rickenella mellea]
MTNPQTAVPTAIASISESHVGRKLRLAGRLLSFDDETQLILLQDDSSHAVLVDVSLCIDPMQTPPELRDTRTIVNIVGYLETSNVRISSVICWLIIHITILPCQTELHVPIIHNPALTDAPDIDPFLVLRALLLIPTADLDLGLWHEGIRLREEEGVGVAEGS